MNLIRWQPRMVSRRVPNETRSLFDEWDRMFDEFLGWAPARSAASEEYAWVPRVDVKEEKDRYLVDFELPGLDKDDIKVTMENGMLTVSGERKHEETREDDKVYRRERSYGKFCRSLRLPEDVDGDKVEAGFKNGILRIGVGKKEEAKPRAIEIK